MKKGTIVRVAGFAALSLAALQTASAQKYEPTVMEYLQNDGRFSTFLRLAKNTGVDSWFRQYSVTGCTVVAPTDSAFARVPQSVMSALSQNRGELTRVIQYHVILREKSSVQIRQFPKTLEGDPLYLTGGVPQRTANIVSKDVQADNGEVQVVDQVLFPPAVFKGLQRDGAFPIAVGLGFYPRMTASGVVHDVPTVNRKSGSKAKKRSKGHYGRVPGSYGRVWIPASG
jgi:uncharacterized surface protein with fasciclin (FAS1) repeats